jgi:hypothetical protein
MRHLKKHQRLMAKQVKGLQSDIKLASADVERNRARIEKLRDEINNIQSENLLIALDIKTAEQLIEKISSI